MAISHVLLPHKDKFGTMLFLLDGNIDSIDLSHTMPMHGGGQNTACVTLSGHIVVNLKQDLLQPAELTIVNGQMLRKPLIDALTSNAQNGLPSVIVMANCSTGGRLSNFPTISIILI